MSISSTRVYTLGGYIVIDTIDNVFKFDIFMPPLMPGKRGKPKSEFPQLRVTKETYEKLRKLKFKLELETMDEVVSWLMDHSEMKL